MILLKKLIIITLSLFLFSVSGQEMGIRKDFHQKKPDKAILKSILTDKSYEQNNLSIAYKGLCNTMMADYVFLPSSKLSYFKKGKEQVERAIKESPNNVELRYIRLMVQLNSPSFLGYNNNISDDIKLFIKLLPDDSINNIWKVKFIENLQKGKHISESQILELQTLKMRL